MATIKNISRLLNVIDRSLFTICGKLDYDRIIDSTIALAVAVDDFDGPEETEELWWIESPCTNLADFIVGAYWHFTEWHKGQYSKEMEALCLLGSIFNPGMSGIEEENETYQMLAEMAENR